MIPAKQQVSLTIREGEKLADNIKIVAARKLGTSDISRWNTRKLKLTNRRDHRIVPDTPLEFKAQTGKLVTAIIEHELISALTGDGFKETKSTPLGEAGLQLITDRHNYTNEIFKFVTLGRIHQFKQGVVKHFPSSLGLLSYSTPIEHDKVAQ